MKVKNDKKVLVLSFLGVITLILVVVGATYAYFTAQGGGTGNINVDANTATTDNLSFQTGNAINITANEEDFGQGAGNKSGTTFARATLTANNATNNATRNYYVYLDITDNNFEYTTDDNQAEILLKVTDPDGVEVTSIPGLTRKTSGSGANEVTGFDITTTEDLIKIVDNYEITSTGTTTQEWQIEVIFVNLDSDQNANTGKTFSANLIIQEGPLQSRVNLASYITDTLYTEDGVNNLYYHDGVGDYVNADQEAGDNSYRFSGGDYQVTDKAIGEGLTKIYTAYATDTDGVINFYCNDEKQFVGYHCNSIYKYYYTTAYNEISHYNTLEEALNQAVADEYLTADNINNFVCFDPGASEDLCPADNLYRIIGIFNGQAKLIKYDYADITMLGEDGDYDQTLMTIFYSGKRSEQGTSYRYYWNYIDGSGSVNTWSQSRLNTVNLNTNYWNYLTSEWQEKIATTTWKVGGNTWDSIGTQSAKTVFTNEIIIPAEETTYQDEIGLMYVSDYMYAVNPMWWSIAGFNNSVNDYREIKEDNWMYMGDYEWTISKDTNYTNGIFHIHYEGNVATSTNYPEGSTAIRPVFYLNSDVQIYEGHAGTASDPYRIVI